MDDAVHFPPLEPGEEVIATRTDGLLIQGQQYTISENLGPDNKLHSITLVDVSGSFPEVFFNRKEKKLQESD